MEKEIAVRVNPTGEDIGEPPATVMGLRRSALIEIGLFLVSALVIDYLFFGGTRYAHLATHPFWLIVLLISAQYGTGEGLVAAGLSTVCLLAGNIPEQSLTQDWYGYVFDICRLPISWFVLALILGELRMRQIRERDRLRQDLAKTQERETQIAEAYRNLSVGKDKLEARVASQMSTALTIYQAAREIEKLEPADVLRGIAEVVRAVMKPDKFSIYILRENILEVAIHEGWSGEDRFQRTFSHNSRIFRAVIGAQRYLCAADPEDESILSQEGLLAGPLMCSESGEILGLVKIERLGFLRLNFTNVQTFKAVCRWVGTAYANALRHQDVRSDSLINNETRLFSHGFFKQHTAHLSELARRIGFDLSMVIVRLDNEDELSLQQRSMIPAALAQALRMSLRRTDLAFEYRRGFHEYAVVLPDTPVMNAELVADKLLKALKGILLDQAGQARFSSSVQSLISESRDGRVHIGELLPRQVDFLLGVARRVGFELSMIDICLSDPGGHSPEVKREIHRAVYQILEDTLPRECSLVSCRPLLCKYQVFLYPVSLEGARAASDSIADSVARRMEALGIRAEFACAVQAMHQHQVAELQDARR